jgi:YD repeat-containing protein
MNHLYTSTMTRGSTTQTRTFVYNDAGQLTSAANPESGTVTYTYNSDGTLQKKTDALSNYASYTYDSNKRITEVQHFNQWGTEDTCQRVTYAYDTNPIDSTFSSNTAGRLTAVQYGSTSTSLFCGAGVTSDMYAEEYSYHAAGGMTAKRLILTRTVDDSSYGYGLMTASAHLDVAYTYDADGRQSTVAYNILTGSPWYDPSTVSPTTVTYTTGYDSMGRPSSLVDNNPGSDNGYSTSWVQNVTYDLAGRRTSLQRIMASSDSYATEAQTYNVNGQLASVGWSGWGSLGGTLTYTYSSTQNNGQITQMTDSVSGETVVYTYDALKRLTSAAATPNYGSTPTAWTQTFQYDGFGNLTAKVLNGTTTTIGVTASTNRLSGGSYDANGNMTTGAGATMTYDGSNRMVTVSPTSGGTEYYVYAPDSKRVSGPTGFVFYGARGEKLGTYYLQDTSTGPYPGESYSFVPMATNVWFAGKLIEEWNSSWTGTDVYQDRLGTNRDNGARFRPYGDEITSTANDHVKYGTYTRDSFSMLSSLFTFGPF